MDLIIITQRDPIFIDAFLKEINYQVFRKVVIYDVPNFGSGKLSALKRFWRLFGFSETILAGFKTLTSRWTIPPNVVIIKRGFNGVLNEICSNDWSTNDILLSVSAPKKIDVQSLSKFTTKINFHSGKLPTYAGMMPMFWQMFSGEKSFTITMHEISEEIDQGDILFEASYPLIGTLFNNMILSKQSSANIFNRFVSGDLKVNRKKGAKVTHLRSYPDDCSIRQLRKKENG